MSSNQPNVVDNSSEQQVRQTRNSMLITGAGTVLLGGFIAYQLFQVEFGTAQSVRVWAPVALLYNSFGFWPAILCVPVLGVVILLVLARKLRSIRESSSTIAPSQ
jgi:hypothetical protein